MKNKLFMIVLVLICTFFISLPVEVEAYNGVEVVQRLDEAKIELLSATIVSNKNGKIMTVLVTLESRR